MIESEKFSQWLKKNTKLSSKSVRDTVSRVKRASDFIDLYTNLNIEETLFILSQHQGFKKLNVDIRSQLKRAVKLFRKFYLDKTQN